jgi:hypothetical protein
MRDRRAKARDGLPWNIWSMTSRIDASPAVALTEIERALRNAPPPPADAVAVIQRQLAQFGAAAAAESVIESYYGCLVTEHVRRVFDIVPDTLPLIINSSHRAVRRARLSRARGL